MRKPIVDNKYNLKPKDIERAKVIDYNKVHNKPFWRNDVVNAWCLTDTTVKNKKDFEFGTYNEYWIGFYDDGRIKLNRYSYGGMCGYNFKSFFNPNEIHCEIDLEIQEKLLDRINWLIDSGIIKIDI